MTRRSLRRGLAGRASPRANGRIVPRRRPPSRNAEEAAWAGGEGAGSSPADGFVDGVDKPHVEPVQHLPRHLDQVLAVAAGEHHPLDPCPGGGEHLRLDAAHRERAAAERDLAGERHGAERVAPRERGKDRRREGDAGRGASATASWPRTVMCCGEGASHVAEELALEERLGERRAVAGHEAALAALAAPVQAVTRRELR